LAMLYMRVEDLVNSIMIRVKHKKGKE
jgi:hypothetical protein